MGITTLISVALAVGIFILLPYFCPLFYQNM